MTADAQSLVGKWLVRFKKWNWEYHFTVDGSVSWRDPLNGLTGKGRWAQQGNWIHLTWFGSKTRESWKCPVSADAQSGWCDAPYGVGPLTASKQSEQVSPQPNGAPVNPSIANLPFDRYIDLFDSVKYDMNYKIPPHKSFAYSTILSLSWRNGASIEIDFETELMDVRFGSAQARDAMAQGYVREGRIFPRLMAPATVPRLWAAREDALAAQQEDYKAFASVAIAGVAWSLNVPAMPAGLPPATGVAIGRARVPGVPRNTGVAISEAEMAAIQAIRSRPEYAKLAVEEIAALRAYGGENFGKINLALRSGGGDPQATALANAIVSGLKKMPGYSGKLFRSEARQVGDAAQAYRKGSTFRPTGLFSTARGAAPASREGNVAINVTAIGKNGKDVSQVVPHGQKELEVLFPPGSSFIVENVIQTGQAFIVFLREI
jgi:hypothetical protein